MSEEYTNEVIENTRRQMKILGYDNIKRGMLDSVLLTGSWLGLEDLKEIMQESEYQELVKTIETRERGLYTRERYPEISNEELEEAIQDEINRTRFVMDKDGEKKHNIKEFFAFGEDKIIKPIDVKDIDGAQLARTIAAVMQRHLNYGVFHANKYYSAEELERALQIDIDRLKREEIVFQQDKGEVQKEGKQANSLEEDKIVSIEKIRKQKESATEAPFQWHGTIDKAVEYLQECKENGQNVYIEFNGNILYSCDVTLDSAYLQLTGLTKEESDKAVEEMSETFTVEDGKVHKDEEKRKAMLDKYNKLKKEHIDEAKQSATEAPSQWHGTIDKAVEYLQDCKRKGENVYVDFNGHKLYSCDVTLDSAYLEVVGVTKEEDDAILEEYGKAKTKEEKKAIIQKWNDIKKAHEEAGDKKGNPTVLESAVEATEGSVKVSSIKEQVEGVKEENTLEEIKEANGTEMSE